MSINTDDYFRKPFSGAQFAAASDLLKRVNDLAHEAERAGAFTFAIDPDTGCAISGRSGGDGDGGFRTPSSTTGAPSSSHREARGVDVYDPGNRLDRWLDGFEANDGAGGNRKLEEFGLYREAPSATNTWCHLTTRPPQSGARTFNP